MHKTLIALVIAIPALGLPNLVDAKGCLKGAVVGGVAGHVAGHHGLVGAAAGCAIEHHREKVKDRQMPQPAATPSDSPPPAMRTKDVTSPK